MLPKLTMNQLLGIPFQSLVVCIPFCFSACQKRPDIAPAADNMSALEPPPMGGTTYNDELKREIKVLGDLINGRINPKTVAAIKKALTAGHVDSFSNSNGSLDAVLAKLFITFPSLLRDGQPPNTPQKEAWLKAKLYFIRRRFIEAATLMTKLLKDQPNFFEARNWRARSIFFLGNPDLAIKELEEIISAKGEGSREGLEALYLIGAMVYESNDDEQNRIKKGLYAWEQYLKQAKLQRDVSLEIKDGLAELKGRLTGSKSNKSKALDPFLPNERYSQEKNAVMTAFIKGEILLAKRLAELAQKDLADPDIATVLARALFRSGEQDKALETFEKIIKGHPGYAPAYHYYGMTLMMKGKPKEAISSWKKTLELDKNYGESHSLRKRISVAQRMVDPKRAPVMSNKAAKDGP